MRRLLSWAHYDTINGAICGLMERGQLNGPSARLVVSDLLKVWLRMIGGHGEFCKVGGGRGGRSGRILPVSRAVWSDG